MNQEKNITVMVPTRNRPDFLRQALASVQHQTARNSILEVVVSENGGVRESEKVIAEFSELPIRYIFREPIIGALEHHTELFCHEARTQYVAALHDDDWWQRDYLLNSIEMFSQFPSATAVASSFILVSEEQAKMTINYGHEAYCFGANFPKFEPAWELTFSKVAAASFMRTPAHFSAMVVRRDALIQATKEVAITGNQFDIDRMLLLVLAQQGSVIYRLVPDVIIRDHSKQDQKSFSSNMIADHMIKTTAWIYEQCKANHIDLNAEIASRLISCPPEMRQKIYNYLSVPWCIPDGIKIVAATPLLNNFAPPMWRSDLNKNKIKALIKKLTPPCIIDLIQFIRKRC